MEGPDVESFKEALIDNARRAGGFGTWADFEQRFRLAFAPINRIDNAIIELGSI